jgi:hypothetical protein
MGSVVGMIRYMSIAKQCLIIELWYLFASYFGFMISLRSFRKGQTVCAQKRYVSSLLWH